VWRVVRNTPGLGVLLGTIIRPQDEAIRVWSVRASIGCTLAAMAILALDLAAPPHVPVAFAYTLVIGAAVFVGDRVLVLRLAMLATLLVCATTALDVAGSRESAEMFLHPAMALSLVWFTGLLGVLLRDDDERRHLSNASSQSKNFKDGSPRMRSESLHTGRDEFLAVLSHELRTPLQAMASWLDVLDQLPPGAPAPQRVKTALRRAMAAESDLISDLLEVSRIVTSKTDIDRAPVDVRVPVGAAVAAFAQEAEQRGILLSFEGFTSELPVLGDVTKIGHLTRILLSNALKFTPRGGRVAVFLRETENREAELSVEDTGDGIEAEALPHVFERFWIGDGSRTRRHGGLGLGLAIAQNIVLRHEGVITATSGGPGHGTTFTVRLPLHVHSVGNLLAQAGPTDVEQSLRGLNILVVEDDAAAREALAESLRTRGATVAEAASVHDAVQLFLRWHPTVVLSDVGMPDHDGLELAREIRARCRGTNEQPLLIAVSGFASREDRVAALEAGFDDHLPKPLSGSALTAAVKNRLRSAAP
jgi:signal transduction histidine kinase/ActR/RegA family two-component response regulator